MSSGAERSDLTVAIHQPEFLPWLGFIDKIRQCEVFVLLDCVQFEKHDFQNRNRVRTATGSAWLTVPVLTRGRSTQPIHDVAIRADDPWTRKHLQTVSLSYRAAPFFARYFRELEALYAE